MAHLRVGLARPGVIGVIAVLALGLATCSPVPVDSPAGAVRSALDRVVAHDLSAASRAVCLARRNPLDFPFSIPGVFAPVQALPGFNVPRTLSVISLDASRLSTVETVRTGDQAQVHLSGTLIQRFEPDRVEALFRAYAAESGQPIDQDLLAETLRNVGHGDVLLPIDELIPVIREDGEWKVCPPAATP